MTDTQRKASLSRRTAETDISLSLHLDDAAPPKINTGIPFFDHMLHLMAAHGLFYLDVNARGDLEVDAHHTVEDVGLVLGDALETALGDRIGIRRYGHALVPMDETLAEAAVDLSRRPYLVFTAPDTDAGGGNFDIGLAREFFRAFCVKGGLNLHLHVRYGDNRHHILEAAFKALGRALRVAVELDPRGTAVPSTKGIL